jgi:enoyl-[acyl-carrier-protein] reductase (NADH)
MTRKEIEKKKARLVEILKEEDPGKRRKDLEELAKIVGASITRMERVQTRHNASTVYYDVSNEITETEIVHNIQFALQTETMVEACRISARNFWVALVATVIALLAMFAAWAAVAVKAKVCVP